MLTSVRFSNLSSVSALFQSLSLSLTKGARLLTRITPISEQMLTPALSPFHGLSQMAKTGNLSYILLGAFFGFRYSATPRNMKLAQGWGGLLAFLLVLLISCNTHAAPFEDRMEFDKTAPVTINADSMHYDREAETVSAIGNVEVIQGGRVLLASLITYHQPSQRVMAKGSVNVLEPDGNHYTAEEVELTQDLKQGVIEQFHARLSDNSTFTAKRAIRKNENETELEHARYTPCHICRDDETGRLQPPLWQIRANEVKINEAEEKVEYEHPRLEVYGVPVIYSPYLSHPTPDAKRQSGILRPTYGLSSQLGTMISVPYYVNIAPQMDATITPLITTKEGVVMQGEYRHLLPSGQYRIAASGTYPERRDNFGNLIDGHEFRGHIEADGGFQLNNRWAWGFNMKRSSDDTYLRRYDISHEDTLVSRLFLNGMGDHRSEYDRSFFLAEGLSFQGLRVDDDPETTPLIAPLIRFSHETPASFAGGRFGLRGDAMSLTRQEGSHTHRLSLNSYWRKHGVFGYGQLWDVQIGLRGDGYLVTDLPQYLGGDDRETTLRLIPEARLTWRYPWKRRFEKATAVIEPVAEFIASPNHGKDDDIPNEDSIVQEFDATNLFYSNRFTGQDRYEDGLRANVGIRTSVTMDDGPTFSALIGQHLRTRPEDTFNFASDLTSQSSDYVAMVTMESDVMWLLYRARMDDDNLESRRQEISANLNFHPIKLSLDYFSMNEDPLLQDREEAFASASYKLNDNWTLTGGGRRDLDESEWIDARAGLTYMNECLTIISSLRREFTRDRDVKPSTSLTFQLSLKNLN